MMIATWRAEGTSDSIDQHPFALSLSKGCPSSEARHPKKMRCFDTLSTNGFRMNPTTHLARRSEEHTSELQSLMRISYAVFCLKKKKKTNATSTKDSTATLKSTRQQN